MDKLSFHEWLLEVHDFDRNDIENLLSSDELNDLYEEYEDYLKER